MKKLMQNTKNQLTFIQRTTKYPNPKGLYKCSCGNIAEIHIGNVQRGHTVSCGCAHNRMLIERNKTHGLRHDPLYSVWSSIKNRCYNKKSPDYRLYGGRGVRMADSWVNNPENFINWAKSNGWGPRMQIDKDILGDGLLYSESTCKFVTNKINSNNRRGNVVISYNGYHKTLKEWSEYFNVKFHTFRHRVKISGWDIVEYLKNSNKWRV